jgi:hypothetical protein
LVTVAWTYKRVFSGASENLLGASRRNGLVAFGEVPKDTELCPAIAPPQVTRATGWRPLLASLVYTRWDDVDAATGIPIPTVASVADVLMTLTERRIPGQAPPLQTAADNPRWSERIFFELGVDTVSFAGVLIPVDDENGHPFDLRVKTFNGSGGTDSQLIVDWDWERQGGTNVTVRSLQALAEQIQDHWTAVAETERHPSDVRLLQLILDELQKQGAS